MAELTGLPLLKRLMQDATPDTRPLYAPERLRFAIETAADGTSLTDSGTTMQGALETLIESAHFTLDPLFEDQGGEASFFFTFSPDGLDRILPDEMLFAVAADLRQALGLISCEPDTGAQVFTDPSPEPPTTTEGAILDATCWAPGEPPEPKDWARSDFSTSNRRSRRCSGHRMPPAW